MLRAGQRTQGAQQRAGYMHDAYMLVRFETRCQDMCKGYTSDEMNAAQARAANLLGALALRLVDEMSGAITDASALGDSASTALVALARNRKRPIEYLRRVLGLSHPATVRLVDRLCELGLVTRQSGADGRSVTPALTRAGRRKAKAVAQARAVVLENMLKEFDQASCAQVARVLESFLEAAPKNQQDAANLCRLCDLSVCNRGAPCPVDVGIAKRASPAFIPNEVPKPADGRLKGKSRKATRRRGRGA